MTAIPPLSAGLLAKHPGLTPQRFIVTSATDTHYNCVAWAAGDQNQWWWPTCEEDFWPEGVPREESLDAFRQAFESLGFSVVKDGALDLTTEKVAIFAVQGVPSHAARQLPSGRWTSKLGALQDMEHDLEALVDERYGAVALFLGRPRGSQPSSP